MKHFDIHVAVAMHFDSDFWFLCFHCYLSLGAHEQQGIL